jgi:hypothetical protein
MNSFTNAQSKSQRIVFLLCGALLVYLFAFHNLTRFPAPWFDEGSHLHVPKTLVKYGVYADISSEGFRYYGPTIGVGPTVMLPIAAMFRVFGIGLLQARIVMALYLVAAVWAFFLLVEHLAGRWIAVLATILMLSSRSVLFLEYGRQLLGEVPGFFFLVAALYLWFSKWNESRHGRLALIGLLFGLAVVTKYQYLLFLAPTLVLAWLANALYYRTSPHRHFLIPGIIAAAVFGLWQLFTLQYLGPATAQENLALLRASAQAAAFHFNLTQLAANAGELTSRAAYLGTLIPALLYGMFLSLARTRESQKWNVIFLLVALNLAWYVVASIGWLRYAFLGFSLASVFVARLFVTLMEGFKFEPTTSFVRSLFDTRNAARLACALWLLAIVAVPLAKTAYEIALPEPPAAQEMSRYLDQHVPPDAVIETWDPEMGFFSDHNYHYPPNGLLAVAIDQVYYGGESVQGHYDFVRNEQPDYLLLGEFSKWTAIYPFDELQSHYKLVHTVGVYDLYQRAK